MRIPLLFDLFLLIFYLRYLNWRPILLYKKQVDKDSEPKEASPG